METLIVRPENKKQLAAIKAVIKAMKIPFKETKEVVYDPAFVKMIKQGQEDIKAGKGKVVEIDTLFQ